MLSRGIILLNNSFQRLRSPRCAAGQVLVLIPSCLQSSKCKQRVNVDISECRRCGNCGVNDMLAMADEYGVRVACATGGRLALEMLRSDAVKAVVAVACEKELRAGLIGAFPKPVLAVTNLRPNGPCKDTAVDICDVRRAIEYFTGKPASPKK